MVVIGDLGVVGGSGRDGGGDPVVLVQPLDLQGGESGSRGRKGSRDGKGRRGVRAGTSDVHSLIDADGAGEG